MTMYRVELRVIGTTNGKDHTEDTKVIDLRSSVASRDAAIAVSKLVEAEMRLKLSKGGL